MLPNRIRCFPHALLFSIPLILLSGCGVKVAQFDVPLKIQTPPETISRELDREMPNLMRKNVVPGAAVTLIRDGKIAFTKYYGRTNSLFNEKVGPHTVFEAASLGKVISSYGAMRLAEQGHLKVDRSLHEYVKDAPYLPPSKYRDHVTLERILTHSAGLPNNILWKSTKIHFPPGERHSYSGAGINYLGYVITRLTGLDYASFIHSAVLAPLNMRDSSFVHRTDYVTWLAHGHLNGLVLLAVAMFFYILFAAPLFLIWGVHRLFVRGRPVRATTVFLINFISIVPTALFLVLNMRFSSGIVIFLLLQVLVPTLILLSLFFLFTRSADFPYKTLGLTACGTSLLILLLFLAAFSLPTPLRAYEQSNPAASLYSTPHDMALFMLEFLTPPPERAPIIEKMLTPRIQVKEDFHWGLGTGVVNSRHGRMFFQWGMQPDYSHLWLGRPDHKMGIVIMTNSQFGLAMTPEIVRIALGGDFREYWHDVSSIQF